jgi:hypothetical protein
MYNGFGQFGGQQDQQIFQIPHDGQSPLLKKDANSSLSGGLSKGRSDEVKKETSTGSSNNGPHK